jgi:hypothetical protein
MSGKIEVIVLVRGESTGRAGGSSPLQLVHSGNMGRVREKKRWKKEEKWREREEEEVTSPPELSRKFGHWSLGRRRWTLDRG